MITALASHCCDVGQQAFVRCLNIRHVRGSGVDLCCAILDRHGRCVGYGIIKERSLTVCPLSSMAEETIAQRTKQRQEQVARRVMESMGGGHCFVTA